METRDYKIIGLMLEQKFLTLSQFLKVEDGGSRLFPSESALRNRLSALKKQKIIDSIKNGNGTIYFPTNRGYKMLVNSTFAHKNLFALTPMNKSKYSPVIYEHTVILTDIRFIFESSGFIEEWEPERVIQTKFRGDLSKDFELNVSLIEKINLTKKKMAGIPIPDAECSLNGCRAAIELELSSRSIKRMVEKLLRYKKRDDIEVLIWIFYSETKLNSFLSLYLKSDQRLRRQTTVYLTTVKELLSNELETDFLTIVESGTSGALSTVKRKVLMGE
jgi:hypothetical protein